MISDKMTPRVGANVEAPVFARVQMRQDLRVIHTLVYVYLFLLLFEGAFRKWVLFSMPNIAGPFLLIRDPVVVLIYILTAAAGLWPRGKFLVVFYFVGGLMVCLAFAQNIQAGAGNFLVSLYGLRAYLLHVPLIFVLPSVLTEKEVVRIGRWILLLTPFMTALMIVQFLVPADHFLNRGSVEGSGQIRSALDRIRMAGTFSYNTGAAKFYLLATVFTLYSVVRPNWISFSWSIAALTSIAIVLPMSGSRTLVLSFAVATGFALFGGYFNPRLLGVSLGAFMLFLVIVFMLAFNSVFRDGIDVFAARWDEGLGESGQFNDAIVGRFVSDYTDAFTVASDTPVWGRGLGLGSNVGAKLVTGELDFLLAESEWPRSIMEMGPIFGFVWLLFRVALAVFLFVKSWRALSHCNVLPWLLLSTCLLDVLNAPMAQTMSMGFMVFSAGITLAAINLPRVPLVPRFRGSKAAS